MVRPGGDDPILAHRNGKRQAVMVIRNETERRTDSLNGFLRRWRRNSAYGGLLAAALAFLAAAAVLVALCACKSFR